MKRRILEPPRPAPCHSLYAAPLRIIKPCNTISIKPIPTHPLLSDLAQALSAPLTLHPLPRVPPCQRIVIYNHWYVCESYTYRAHFCLHLLLSYLAQVPHRWCRPNMGHRRLNALNPSRFDGDTKNINVQPP